jgi:hypothetical protein
VVTEAKALPAPNQVNFLTAVGATQDVDGDNDCARPFRLWLHSKDRTLKDAFDVFFKAGLTRICDHDRDDSCQQLYDEWKTHETRECW